jgi:hypothetical protein
MRKQSNRHTTKQPTSNNNFTIVIKRRGYVREHVLVGKVP